MAFEFKKAKKEKVWVKVLLASPSGGGKTYSALRLATGIAKKCGSRIAAIDTENGRIRYYANEFDFDDIQLDSYEPENYIEAIQAAEDAGYKVLIIDSVTHEWNYCLETVEKIPGANSYIKWGKVTPRHNAFLEAVLQSKLHIIATVRGKDSYVLEDKNGKQVPKKVGLGLNQRDGIEYEYTVTFNLDQENHVAQATKDNTHTFEGRYEVLTEKDGEKLFNWANDGEEMKKEKPVVPMSQRLSVSTPTDDLESIIEEIDATAKALKETVEKDVIVAKIKEGCGKANYRNITDIETANKTLELLKELK